MFVCPFLDEFWDLLVLGYTDQLQSSLLLESKATQLHMNLVCLVRGASSSHCAWLAHVKVHSHRAHGTVAADSSKLQDWKPGRSVFSGIFSLFAILQPNFEVCPDSFWCVFFCFGTGSRHVALLWYLL